jgi:hypothetical protein
MDYSVITWSEFLERQRKRSILSNQIKEDARGLRLFGMEDDAVELERTALSVDKFDWLYDHPVAPRHRTEKHLRGYVLKLGNICGALFGSPLYGTLAAITNVAFDRRKPGILRGGHIHEMLRGSEPWGMPPELLFGPKGVWRTG